MHLRWCKCAQPNNGRAELVRGTNVDAKLSRVSEDFRLSISGGAILSATPVYPSDMHREGL